MTGIEGVAALISARGDRTTWWACLKLWYLCLAFAPFCICVARLAAPVPGIHPVISGVKGQLLMRLAEHAGYHDTAAPDLRGKEAPLVAKLERSGCASLVIVPASAEQAVPKLRYAHAANSTELLASLRGDKHLQGSL